MAIVMDKDKLLGMFCGVALGDASGAPYERRTRQLYNGTIRHQNILRSQFQGTRISVLGQVTDDFEMTMALLNTIKSEEGYTQESVTKAYLEWANSKCPFLGRNTRNLFYGIKTLKGYNNRKTKYIDNIDVYERTQSNGCLMRATPLVLVEDPSLDTILTNNNPVCIEAVCVYVNTLKQICMGEKDARQLVHIALKNCKQVENKKAIRQALRKEPRDITGTTKGWICHALYCAYYALMLTIDHQPHEIMFKIITLCSKQITDTEWKIGNTDTDTTGAIAGGLIGAYFGYKNLQKDKIIKKNLNIINNVDTEGGGIPRPKKYLFNIDTLKKLLA